MYAETTHEERGVSRPLQRVRRPRPIQHSPDSVEKQQNPYETMTEATRTSTETYSQQTTRGYFEVSNNE